MRTTANDQPSVLLALGQGRFHFNYNVSEVETEEGPVFEYDTVEISGTSYEEVVNAMIRERYTISDELAILRQKETKVADFENYYSYCEECKMIAHVIK